MKSIIFQEMIDNGYLLPAWIPLDTKYPCEIKHLVKKSTEVLLSYKPHDHACVASHT